MPYCPDCGGSIDGFDDVDVGTKSFKEVIYHLVFEGSEEDAK